MILRKTMLTGTKGYNVFCLIWPFVNLDFFFLFGEKEGVLSVWCGFTYPYNMPATSTWSCMPDGLPLRGPTTLLLWRSFFFFFFWSVFLIKWQPNPFKSKWSTLNNHTTHLFMSCGSTSSTVTASVANPLSSVSLYPCTCCPFIISLNALSVKAIAMADPFLVT